MDFDTIKTIAVVGLSDKNEKASYQVAKYLQDCGYKIVPVNPALDTVLGEKSYPDLSSIPSEINIDVVDIFRRSEAVTPIVQEAVTRGGIGIIWMQEGVINEEAAGIARTAGMDVIMDKCILKEHQACKLNR